MDIRVLTHVHVCSRVHNVEQNQSLMWNVSNALAFCQHLWVDGDGRGLLGIYSSHAWEPEAVSVAQNHFDAHQHWHVVEIITPTATWHPHSVRVAFYNWHSDRSWRLWVVALWVAKMRHHVEILVYRARGLKSIFIPPCPPIAAPTNSSSSVQSWWVNAANSQPLDGPVDTSIPQSPLFTHLHSVYPCHFKCPMLLHTKKFMKFFLRESTY